MKKQYALAAILFCSLISRAETIEVPEWVNQVDAILSGVQGMEEMLVKDVELYLNLTGTLEGMFGDFDRREAERLRLFAAVREKVNNLQSQLALSESNCAAALEEKNTIIRDLESDIISIRFETQLEIDRLSKIIDDLSKELQATRQAYATLIDMNGDKAEALISQMTAIKQAYGSMIDSRATFLATLDRFINRTRAHLSKASADGKELGIEIVGAGFLTQEPASEAQPEQEIAEEAVAPEETEQEQVADVAATEPTVQEEAESAPQEEPENQDAPSEEVASQEEVTESTSQEESSEEAVAESEPHVSE